MRQFPSAYLLCRPASFSFNSTEIEDVQTISKLALEEFDAMVALLLQQEVSLVLVNDTDPPKKPDAVFPNNWFSTHTDGHIIIYPMEAPNRRFEVRFDVLDAIAGKYNLQRRIDLQPMADENKFLEGTGSLVFDHVNKKCFASISSRTHPELVHHICKILGYQPVIFTSYNKEGKLIYHTNVVLSIGKKFAIICDEVIPEREKVLHEITESGLEIISISINEMQCFGANLLQIKNRKEKDFIVLSETALNGFRPEILIQLNKYGKLLPVAIPTIEKVGGGSARCMIAEVFSCSSSNEGIILTENSPN
jgi:hypothetical protein